MKRKEKKKASKLPERRHIYTPKARKTQTTKKINKIFRSQWNIHDQNPQI